LLKLEELEERLVEETKSLSELEERTSSFLDETIPEEYTSS
jgi:hypothetical protein